MNPARDRKNLLFGLVSSAWSALVALAVVPFYLRFLGLDYYGLIGFFVALQSIFVVLDMGLSATMSREVARCRAEGVEAEARSLLQTLQYIYWATAAAIALGLMLAAGPIAEHWLHDTAIPRGELKGAIGLMGLVIALRWPVALYSGALIGAHRLSLVSLFTIAAATLTNVGAVIVLWRIAPTIHAFFLWQALCALLHACGIGLAARRQVGTASGRSFDWQGLKRIWRFSGGLSIAAVVGAIFMQSDKLVLSRLVPLSDLGGYTLAVTAARALYIVLTPAFNVVYPQMTRMLAEGDEQALIEYYRAGTRLLIAVIVPASTFVALFSYPLLLVWTGNEDTARFVAPLVAPIIAGTALNGVMHFPYALQLAAGKSRLPAMINLVLLVLFVPMLIALTGAYGVMGGAVSWMLLNALYVLLGTWLTHREILPGLASRWLLGDVGAPALLGLGITAAGAIAARAAFASWSAQLAFGALSAALALVACLLVFTRVPALVQIYRLRRVAGQPR